MAEVLQVSTGVKVLDTVATRLGVGEGEIDGVDRGRRRDLSTGILEGDSDEIAEEARA